MLAESLAHEAASAEILGLIRRSRGDCQPVFVAIARGALRLIGARAAVVVRRVGEGLHLAALAATTDAGGEALRRTFPVALADGGPLGRAVITGRPAWIGDIEKNAAFSKRFRESARARGARSIVAVPMLLDGEAIGAVAVTREKTGSSTKRQIGLLQALADSAVIATENVRLFNEMKEALERQTATAEILKVIARSPSDVEPVFDSIAKSARKLLRDAEVGVTLIRGDRIELVAAAGLDETRLRALRASFPRPLDLDSGVNLTVVHGQMVHYPDNTAEDIPSYTRETHRAAGIRAMLGVPLLREGKSIGGVFVSRTTPGAYTEKQIELLRTFADQAVIAIENVRLFNETKEALEQQRASAEVLNVISNSVSDAQPVFEKIVESCERIFATSRIGLNVIGADGLVHAGAYGKFPGAETLRRENFPHPCPGSATGAAISAGALIHYPDALGDPGVPQYARRGAETVGFRAFIMAPLLSEGRGLGAIFVGRETVGSFSEKERALLKTFADQAVIAIENARLFNETREALAHQTAAADVLRVISNSVADAQPVFEQILDCCESLMPNDEIIIDVLGEDGLLHWRAGRGLDPERARASYPVAPPDLTPAYLARGVASYADVMHGDGVPQRIRDAVNAYGTNGSLIEAAMVSQGKLIGTITAARLDLRGYTAKEERLLSTFADQAVIAIQNARLFTETKETLERQTATAEVLQVISSSVADTAPVFEKIIRSCGKLFGVRYANVALLRDDGMIHMVQDFARDDLDETELATMTAVQAQFPRPARDSIHGYAIHKREVLHYPDVANGPDVPDGVRATTALGAGNYSVLFAPMVWEGRGIGTIAVHRTPPAPFADKDIRLLKTFADQAAIAVQNARLFNETKEALERQTATAEILKVIASSPSDVQPVFDAIAHSAHRLFNRSAVFQVARDGVLYIGATAGFSGAGLEKAASLYPMALEESRRGLRAMRDGRVLESTDILAPGTPAAIVAIGSAAGFRSIVTVPLLRGEELLGQLSLTTEDVRPRLDDKQRDLLRTFADQAVIAIENVRLFNETKAALERQTATAEILEVISGSPTDVQPVFEAIVRSGIRLFKDAAVAVARPEGDAISLKAIAEHDPVRAGQWATAFPVPMDREYMHGAAVLDRTMVEVADAREDSPRFVAGRRNFAQTGYRAMTIVPMFREGAAIGTISVVRVAPGPLSDEHKALLRTFADQAVIAIENVRLFNETKEALERQTATAEILKVIASSPVDVQPVFDAIAHSAIRLVDGHSCSVTRVLDDHLHLVALTSTDPAGDELVRSFYPMALDGRHVMLDVVRTARTLLVRDTETDPVYGETGRQVARARGFRTIAYVPMLREGAVIGVIHLAGVQPNSLSDSHVGMLHTFADQAVIAIENVRLFNETKEALERQTATAEILKVISESPTDTQPVFDAIVRSAQQLLAASTVSVNIVENDQIWLGAWCGPLVSEDSDRMLRTTYPLPFDEELSLTARAIGQRQVVELPDVQAPGTPAAVAAQGRAAGFRSIAIVPLIRDQEGIGSIGVTNPMPGWKLSEKQRAMLHTFADQAVIAIENVRLFKELQARTEALTRSVGQLMALGEVGQALSSTLDLDKVLSTIVSRAVQLTGLDGGAIYEFDEAEQIFRLRGGENLREEVVELNRTEPIRMGDGFIGRAATTRKPVQVPDLRTVPAQMRARDLLLSVGFRALLAVPLVREDHVLGALAVVRNAPGEFPPETIALLQTFAAQSAIAIQNARLFREIEQKNRQVEEASKHKSQFLASMSHELRTPLNAILGFNEMLIEGMYGEVPGDMQEPLKDIQTSGKHLLRLINNVLDLAKIEAGRMELALADYSVQDTVESVRATLRPLAAEKGLEFVVTLPEDIPLAYGDSGRITQCLVNLAGNSLKFTKSGKVEIVVEHADGTLRFSVTDTGIGIPAEKIGSLFTEFKQTDATIASEYGGSGLGLSIVKKFVEMHGGRIWVESELGQGSTFAFEIPLRASEAAT